MVPWSWHDPSPNELHYSNAMNVLSFVDGHVAFARVYWSGARFPNGSTSALNYVEPADYDYQWSGDR